MTGTDAGIKIIYLKFIYLIVILLDVLFLEKEYILSYI